MPGENLRILRALTIRRAQIGARKKQGIPADVAGMDDALKTMLDAPVGHFERRIERVIAPEDSSAAMKRCEAGGQSQEGGGRCDMCCFRPHSPPQATIRS